MQRSWKRPVVAVLLSLVLISLPASPAGAKEPASRKTGRCLKVRVYEGGSPTPTVLVNVPMSLVSAAMRVVAASGAIQAAIEAIETMQPGQVIEVHDKRDRVSIGVE